MNDFEGMRCVCGKSLVKDEWLCSKCSEERNKHVMFCHLCGASSDVHNYIGGAVNVLCKNCENVVLRYGFAKESHKRLWRQVNGVDEPIEDVYKIGERIAEVEILMAELKRVLQNLSADYKYDVKLPIFPVLLDGEQAETFIRNLFLEHPIHTFSPQKIAEAAHNISIKQATEICNKLVDKDFLKSTDRGYHLTSKQIEKIRNKMADEISYHKITEGMLNDRSAGKKC